MKCKHVECSRESVGNGCEFCDSCVHPSKPSNRCSWCLPVGVSNNKFFVKKFLSTLFVFCLFVLVLIMIFYSLYKVIWW